LRAKKQEVTKLLLPQHTMNVEKTARCLHENNITVICYKQCNNVSEWAVS